MASLLLDAFDGAIAEGEYLISLHRKPWEQDEPSPGEYVLQIQVFGRIDPEWGKGLDIAHYHIPVLNCPPEDYSRDAQHCVSCGRHLPDNEAKEV